MATPRKVLKKEGDKFQLVDKGPKKESTNASSNISGAEKPALAERHETDVWEELLASVRRRCEERRRQTKEDIGEASTAKYEGTLTQPPNLREEQAESQRPYGHTRTRKKGVLDHNDLVLGSESILSYDRAIIPKPVHKCLDQVDIPSVKGRESFAKPSNNHQLAFERASNESQKRNEASKLMYQIPSSAESQPEAPAGLFKASKKVGNILSSHEQVESTFSREFTASHDIAVLEGDPPRAEGSFGRFDAFVGRGKRSRPKLPDVWSTSEQKGSHEPRSLEGEVQVKEHKLPSSEQKKSLGSSEIKQRQKSFHLVACPKPLGDIPLASAGSEVPGRGKNETRQSSYGSKAEQERPLEFCNQLPSSPGGHCLSSSSTTSSARPSISSRRASGRTSGDEPKIILHEGNLPFTPRRVSGPKAVLGSARSSAAQPSSLEKPIRSILKGSDHDTSTSSHSALNSYQTSPSNLVFDHSVLNDNSLSSTSSRIGSSKSSERSLQFVQEHSLAGADKNSLASSVNSFIQPLDSPLSNQGTRSFELEVEAKLPTTPKKKFEARSAYANRPSPRGDSFEDSEGDHSVNTSAALINICRAGPPTRFESSETLLSEASKRGRRPDLNKKRSFRDICRDIVYKAPPSSEEEQQVKVRAATCPSQGGPKSLPRSKSVPRKIEEAIGSFTRSRKIKMEEAFNAFKISFGDRGGQEAAASDSDASITSFSLPKETDIVGDDEHGGEDSIGIVSGALKGDQATKLSNIAERTDENAKAVENTEKNTSIKRATTTEETIPLEQTVSVKDSKESEDAENLIMENEIPIELNDKDKPQSILPVKPESIRGDVIKCVTCDKNITSKENKSKKRCMRCMECFQVFYCTKGSCRSEHEKVCPNVQRPHTSYRMNSVFLPEALKAQTNYVVWQRGKYIEMQHHLTEEEANFNTQIKDKKGAYVKEIRKTLGWGKNKMRHGLSDLSETELNRLHEHLIRKAFAMPLLEPVPGEPSTKHPYHGHHRNTAMIRCVEHRGHCANCGVECCVSKAIELEMKRLDVDASEKEAMKAIHAKMDLWIRRGNPSTFLKCTQCIMENKDFKWYCPNCFGVCPMGEDGKTAKCGDHMCGVHQSKLNAPCDWHTPSQLADGGF